MGAESPATNPRHAHPLLVLNRLTAAKSPETLFQGAKRAQHQNWRHIANGRKFTDGETAQFAPRSERKPPNASRRAGWQDPCTSLRLAPMKPQSSNGATPGCPSFLRCFNIITVWQGNCKFAAGRARKSGKSPCIVRRQ